MFPPSRFAAAEEEVNQILALCDRSPNGLRILDLPCGPGRHSVAFAARGCEVVGVDLESRYVESAIELARQAGVVAAFREGDIRRFRDDGTFDVVTNLFSSFGYFPEREQNVAAAQTLYENLKPGGHLVLEMTSLEFICGNFQSSSANTFDDGTTLIEERNPTADFRTMRSTWTLFFADGTRYRGGFELTIYSAAELSELLTSVGFRDIAVYGGFDGVPFTPNTRLVLHARR